MGSHLSFIMVRLPGEALSLLKDRYGQSDKRHTATIDPTRFQGKQSGAASADERLPATEKTVDR